MDEKMCGSAVDNIRNHLKNYVVHNKLKSLVIGVSGGIDSALCCALAKPVCDEIKIPLIGRSLPIETNRDDEIKNADLIGEHFCTNYLKVDLSDLYLNMSRFITDNYSATVAISQESWKDSDTRDRRAIRRGNIKARSRMIYLYNLAFINLGMVLSTDNKTEEMLGFFTICGDVGDYAMIQNLWKTEVYELSKYLVESYVAQKELGKAYALQSCIDIVPTDGLGITNSDLEQLGLNSYEEVDEVFHKYLNLKNSDNSMDNHPIIQRYLKTHFKRNWPNKGLSRDELFS